MSLNNTSRQYSSCPNININIYICIHGIMSEIYMFSLRWTKKHNTEHVSWTGSKTYCTLQVLNLNQRGSIWYSAAAARKPECLYYKQLFLWIPASQHTVYFTSHLTHSVNSHYLPYSDFFKPVRWKMMHSVQDSNVRKEKNYIFLLREEI